MLHVFCTDYGLEMRDQETLGRKRGKKRSVVCYIVRETHTRSKGVNRAMFITILQKVKGVKHIEPTKDHGLPDVFDGGVRAESVVDAPVAVRERCASRHRLDRGFVLFGEIAIFQVAIRGRAVQDGMELLCLLVSDR